MIDPIGQIYGRLTVRIELARTAGRHRRRRFLCDCACGNTAEAALDDLRSGHSRSCGCLKLGAHSSGPAEIKVASTTAGAPPAPKFSRKQRRAGAAVNRQIMNTMKKANELGRPISIRTDGRGRMKATIGKAKKPDPGPQPGETIKAVDGNVMPDFPGVPAFPEPHVHDANCEHMGPEIVVDDEIKAELDRIAKMDPFEAADQLVKETLGDA